MLKLFEKMERYLSCDEYKVSITKGVVHIINYLEVVDFSSVRVVIKYRDGVTVLSGKDMVMSKMMDDELLITGKLKSIEYN